MSFECQSYVLVCHPYITCMYLCMSSVCHWYALVCPPYVALVCSFTMNQWVIWRFLECLIMCALFCIDKFRCAFPLQFSGFLFKFFQLVADIYPRLHLQHVLFLLMLEVAGFLLYCPELVHILRVRIFKQMSLDFYPLWQRWAILKQQKERLLILSIERSTCMEATYYTATST